MAFAWARSRPARLNRPARGVAALEAEGGQESGPAGGSRSLLMWYFLLTRARGMTIRDV